MGGLASSAFAKVGSANTFSGNQSVTGNVSATKQLISTVATGTAPLSINSTTQVANLNASLLGGLQAGAFALLNAPNIFAGNQSIVGNLSGSNEVSAGGPPGGNVFSGER